MIFWIPPSGLQPRLRQHQALQRRRVARRSKFSRYPDVAFVEVAPAVLGVTKERDLGLCKVLKQVKLRKPFVQQRVCV